MNGSATEQEEQQEALRVMEKASAELVALVRSTEEMGLEGPPALDHFERDIRELNQQNAMQRAQSVVGERRGSSWNRMLEDKVEVRATVDDTPDDRDELLSLVGGGKDEEDGDQTEGENDEADDSNTDPFAHFSASVPLPPGPLPTPPVFRRGSSATASRQGSLGRPLPRSSTASRGSVRVVGSLTPDMLTALRRTSNGSYGSRRCSSASAPRRPSATAVASAAPRRSSAALSLLSARSSYRQRDTSGTRVNGRVDYAALLGEQQHDLRERKQSIQEYKRMLGQVEDYQKRMLETLDKQLLFMAGTAAADTKEAGAITGPAHTPFPPAVPAAGDFHAIM